MNDREETFSTVGLADNPVPRFFVAVGVVTFEAGKVVKIEQKRGSNLMAPNYYLYEKLAEDRSKKLLREAEQRRLVARLPKQRGNLGRNAAYRLGVFLVKLGMWLKESNQLREPAKDQV